MSQPKPGTPSLCAQALGYGGLIPFVGLALVVWLWGVVPSLLAWLGLQLPVASGLILIAVLLWVCFAVDRVVYTRFSLRAWLPMRLLLTAVASVSCIGSALCFN